MFPGHLSAVVLVISMSMGNQTQELDKIAVCDLFVDDEGWAGFAHVGDKAAEPIQWLLQGSGFDEFAIEL